MYFAIIKYKTISVVAFLKLNKDRRKPVSQFTFSLDDYYVLTVLVNTYGDKKVGCMSAL